MSTISAEDRAHELFGLQFGGEPAVVVRAPGRVNLIGEHTDYNGGFVLPMALEHATWLVARPREDGIYRLASDGFEPVEISMSDPTRATHWAKYAQGMLVRLSDQGVDALGADVAIASDIPIGAGLSSSAALEVGFGLLLDPDVDRVELARHGQWVENEWLGFPSGIMDQLIISTATEGSLKLIDCRSLELSNHSLPEGVSVVVMDTSTRRQLVGSEYAERRESCERAAAAVGVQLLRDATVDDLEDAALDTLDRARARHVIEENARTEAAAAALAAGDPALVGRLMDASHISMRDLFDISSPALNAIVEAASKAPGCYGARMTGGGFAGCGVALVDSAQLDDFVESTADAYRAATGLDPAIYPSTAAGAASVR